MFDLGADPNEIAARLHLDPLLADRVESMPGLRVPGCWNGFELAVRAILGQQISVSGASTLAGCLVQAFGKPITVASPLTHLFPGADVLAQADVAGIGLPESRVETIRSLARALSEGRISFVSVMDVEEFQSRLREIPGIGDWTAQYIAMRALGDPDAFPGGDLGLLRAAAIGDRRELVRRAESWRPWRAYAAMYLWQGKDEAFSEGEERSATRRSPTIQRRVAIA